ncbi:MAG TPA: ABC transporter permease [Blastocatellia bacterium]|nr:ABC transporter permease [Blastocatellia bacterium]
MDTLIQDLRYGFRALVKSRSFTIVAVIALALGIGANTAIFSVVDAVLLRPLPYKNPEQLALIWHNYPQINLPQASICVPCYVEYRDMTSSFEQVATSTGWSVNLTGTGEPERLQGAKATFNYFSTLGAEPAQGRTFVEEEDKPGNNRVAVLSHGLWARRFGSDPNIVGATITLDGQSYNVIGIMPADFVVPQSVDLWSPIAFTPEQLAATNHGNEFLTVIARLKPGVTLGQAQAEMDTLAEQLRPQFYGPNWGISLVSLREQLVGSARFPLLILLGTVAAVLLIACTNVANLLLARASARQKEIAIRTALGATRARVVRQLLTESVLLALAGGLFGLGIAYLGIRLIVVGVPQNISNSILGWKLIGLNPQVLGFTVLVSLITGIIFGLIPAFHASKPDLNDSLKEGGRTGSEGGRRNFVRSVLVVVEVAMALVLLVVAGLLIRSFARLQEVNPGFNPQNVLSMQLSLPRSKYAETDQLSAFYDQALERIKTLPGAQFAAFGTNLPMSGNNSSASFAVEGLQVPPGESSPHGDPHMVSADYFKTMQIPLLAGRYFDERDSKDSLPVTIVDETLAKRYWPDEDAVGKRIAAFFESSQNQPKWRQVVGVVKNVKRYGLDGKIKEQYYFPQSQNPQRSMYLLVRTATDPTSLVAPIRDAIHEVDKDQPIFRVMTMEQVVSNSVAQPRFTTVLLAIFAGVALLLAAVGIYGVMSYSVNQRTHEIGIRMALGARPSDVLKMVLRYGMTITLVGVAIGLAGAFLVTRVMSSLLFGVGAHDPITFAAIPLILAGVALGACFVPARRATKVDPMVALRYE